MRKPSTGRWITLLLALGLLLGCASAPQTRQLLATPGELPPRVELSHIPFFPQQDFQCGPAALATVLRASGIDINAQTLVDEVYLPARKGALQLELLASSRRHGRLPYRIAPTLRALLDEVNTGNPVLVLQNLGLSWAPQWHYAVVVGFDLPQQTIILRSGTEMRHVTRMHTFELTWARGNYWGIVVLTADRLPATAEPGRYLRAVVALENTAHSQTQWRTVRQAYATAVSRWPNNLIAHMGLGNSAYALGELEIAAQAFRAALRDHPDTAEAHNNLAQVLLEQGKLKEAQTHAQRAAALGGRHLAAFLATLAEIRQAQQARR